MKKNIKYLKSFFLVSLLLCVTITNAQLFYSATRESEKAYQKQNFDEAVYLAVDALMKKPSDENAIKALELALPAAIRTNENRIGQLKESTAKFSGDYTVEDCQKIIEYYNILLKMNERILNLPPIVSKKRGPITFEMKNYNNDLRQAKDNLTKSNEMAAEQHYQSGQDLLKLNDRDKSKLAAMEFKKAIRFVSDYKDASSMYEQARKLGIKRIAVIPFENKSGKNQYGAINDMITDQIISDLLNNNAAMEFVEIISRSQLQQVIQEQNLGSSGIINDNTAVQVGKILGVNEIIVGQINQITSSEIPKTQKDYRNEKQMYSQNGNYMVYAQVSEYKKEASSSISGSYKIIDAKTAKFLNGDSFKEDYSFLSQWALYSGDKNALSYDSYRLCGQREENPPIDEERVNIVARKLATSLVKKIITYVK